MFVELILFMLLIIFATKIRFIVLVKRLNICVVCSVSKTKFNIKCVTAIICCEEYFMNMDIKEKIFLVFYFARVT